MPGFFSPGKGPGQPIRPKVAGQTAVVPTQDTAMTRFTLWPGAGPNQPARFTSGSRSERIIPPYVEAMRQRLIYPGRGPRRPFFFKETPKSTYQFVVTGVTEDSTGSALGGCTVHLFEGYSNRYLGEVVSDVSGVFTFVVPGNGAYYVDAYLPGVPVDARGRSLNFLTVT